MSFLYPFSLHSHLNPTGERTIAVSGLPRLYDLKELQGLEEALLVLFEEHSVEVVNIGKEGIEILVWDIMCI